MKNTQSLKAWCGALLTLAFGLSAPAASLTNNFDYAQDYVLNGILGDTNWDGVYLRFGDISGGNVGGNPAGNTLIANSAITFPGYLSLRSSGGDWAGSQSGLLCMQSCQAWHIEYAESLANAARYLRSRDTAPITVVV